MMVFRRTICVVNGHFAAHMEGVSKRNADFVHIYQRMAFGRIYGSLGLAASAMAGNYLFAYFLIYFASFVPFDMYYRVHSSRYSICCANHLGCWYATRRIIHRGHKHERGKLDCILVFIILAFIMLPFRRTKRRISVGCKL